MTTGQLRLTILATAASLLGLLGLQARTLWLGFQDARASFERQVDRLLDQTAQRIDPGDELQQIIVRTIATRDTASARRALAGIRTKLELDRNTLPRRYTTFLITRASPAEVWSEPPGRDPAGARTVALSRVCNDCDASLGIRFDDVGTRTFLADIGGLLALSSLFVVAQVACVGIILAAIARLRREQEHQIAFVNTVAHEFRTPLFSISVASRVLADHPSLQQGDELARQVGVITRAKDRLVRHTERLLDLARLGARHIAIDRAPVDINEIVRRAAAHLEETRIATGASIELALDPDVATVLGDERRLEEAIANLIDNAYKYGGAAPRVVVRTQLVGADVRVEVEDDGPGIAERERDAVFAPFVRLGRGDHHDVKGFGLGLTIAQEVVSAHGGRVEVSAAPGGGARFCLTLPSGFEKT
ncbi:MAG: sensor histidine kinase [Gemmatimonadaceae bacterium]